MGFWNVSSSVTALLSVLIFSSSMWCSTPISAQTPTQLYSHPELYIQIQDSVFVKRVQGNQVLDTNEYCFSASYQYEMIYDSTSRISYIFSECKQNEKRLHLKAWKNGRITSAPITDYNDSTRTDNFILAVDDTISFYREFQWYNPKTKKQNLENYFASDTLDYVVELVDAGTGLRLALLDSFGALSRVPQGTPVLYGLHPIMAKIKYPVPLNLAGKTAFVRVLLNARGDGLYQPVRMDAPTIGLSRALEIGMNDDYLQLFGGGLGKQVGRLRSSFESERGAPQRIRARLLDSRNAVIDFDSPGSDGSVSIVVYDALGSPVFVPFATMKMIGDGSVNFRFPSSGMFIVALMYNDELKSTAKVIVR